MSRQFDKLKLRLRSLFRSNTVEQDLARELRAHVAEEIEANLARGLSPADARAAAMKAFGSVASVEELCRDTRRVRRIENFVRDVRYAVRTLVRQPGLFAAAVTSIALGVGANLTIFSLANTMLLSVPSAAAPDELVMIRTSNGSHVSYRGWQHLDRSGAIGGVAGYQFEQSVNWRDGQESTSLIPLLVTDNFFDVVRPPIAFGRGFTAAEARAELDPHLVVVSDGFWRRRLNSDPQAIGRALSINGEPFIVTGVLAPKIRSIAGFGLAPDVYLPLSQRLVPSLDQPKSAAAQLVGRLRADQGLAAGRAAIAAAAASIPGGDEYDEFKIIREFAHLGGVAQVREFKELGVFFVVLMIVAGLVLAIACANVAGLLLARGLARRREIALRLALGASRGRLIQQLLTESFILALAGVAAGGALATIAFVGLSRVPLPLPLPVELSLSLDWRTASVALILILVSTGVTGLAPALQSTRPALVPAIKLDDRHFVVRRLTMRSVLVAGQVAVSAVLLVAALLFVRSLMRAASIDPGFDVDRLLVAQVSFVEGRQGAGERPALEVMAERVRAVPGVSAAAMSAGVPLTIFSGGYTGTEVRLDGVDGPTRVDYAGNEVGPGYFETMGIRLVRGRDFTGADRGAAARVVVINEEFARRYFKDQDPIGRRIHHNQQSAGDEIIGVVSNGKYRSLSERQEASIYHPLLAERKPRRLAHVLVRTNGDPEALAASVRSAILAADASAAVTLTPMRSGLAFAMLPSQMGSAILGLFGALGTTLAMVGLFGVISFAVSRRTAEIAIRVALGASRGNVLRLVLVDAGRLIASGLLIGLGLAWLVTTPLAAFLVAGVSPLDPLSFAGALAVLALASLAAVWGPAMRALNIVPSRALKTE